MVALLFIGACPPYRAVMEILTQHDHVADEMPQRGRARIAGSAIALASVDSQIVRSQGVSLSAMAWIRCRSLVLHRARRPP